MFENVQKFVRKRKKVDNFIYARRKKFDNCLYARENKVDFAENHNRKLHFRTEKAYVRGLVGDAFRSRLILQPIEMPAY